MTELSIHAAGGAVPVDSFLAASNGAVRVGDDPSAAGVPQPALWAAQTAHKPVWTKCSAMTSKGERCRMARAAGTGMCVSHWQQVGGLVIKGMRYMAGTMTPVREGH